MDWAQNNIPWEEFQSAEFWMETFLTLAIGLLLLAAMVRISNLMLARLHIPPIAGTPMRAAVRWIGILLITALVLQKFGVDLMTSLTAVLAMIAIGLVAVWSMLSHITATVLLIFTRPFQINDVVEFPGEEVRGKVVDLTTFYTILETDRGSTYQVPNNLFFQKPFHCIQCEKNSDPTGLAKQWGGKDAVR